MISCPCLKVFNLITILIHLSAEAIKSYYYFLIPLCYIDCRVEYFYLNPLVFMLICYVAIVSLCLRKDVFLVSWILLQNCNTVVDELLNKLFLQEGVVPLSLFLQILHVLWSS